MHDAKNGVERIRIHGLANSSPPGCWIPLGGEVSAAETPQAAFANHFEVVILEVVVLLVVLVESPRRRIQQVDVELNCSRSDFIPRNETGVTLLYHAREPRTTGAESYGHAANFHDSRFRCRWGNGFQDGG